MKQTTSVVVDADVLEKAKKQGINVSGALNDKLRLMTEPNKQDIPEASLKIICSECGDLVDYCFLCEDRNKVYCQACQDKVNMALCQNDKLGEHIHVRIPGLNGLQTEYINKLPNKAKIDTRIKKVFK